MAIELQIPSELKSGAKFTLKVLNEAKESVEIELTLTANDVPQEFVVLGRPKANKQKVIVGPDPGSSLSISDWGTHAAGTKVVVHGGAKDSNVAVVIV